MESPKSLTAVVHVRFNYKEHQDSKIVKSDLEVMSKILDQAAEMPAEHQELMVKFADYLKGISENKVEAEPSS